MRISSWYWSQVCAPNTQWGEKALLQGHTRRKDRQTKKAEHPEKFQQSTFLGKLREWPGYFWGQSLCSWGQVTVRSWCSCGGGGGLVTESSPTLAAPWTVACRAPLSMRFSRQEYWSGLPFPSPGDLPNPRIKPWSPALQTGSLPMEPRGKP